MPVQETFPHEIKHALTQAGIQCRAIVEAVCGSEARAKDVADAFGLHSKLGWQIWNVVHSDALASYRYLPNEHGLKVWRAAGVPKGVPNEMFDRLEASLEDVRRLIKVHAPDEEFFEMLLDAERNDSFEETEARWRRQASLGNSFMFGARVQCLLSSAILFPAASPNRFSMVRIHGLIGLVRTRIGVRWPISRLVVQRSDGSDEMPSREPLDPQAKVDGVPFLTQYCSSPLPGIERRTDGSTLIDELLPGLVGLTGASTVFTGEILHDVGPTHGLTDGEVAHFGTGIRTPGDLILMDHIVHRSIFPNVARELRVYSELVSSTARDDHDRLTVSERLENLGMGLSRVRTADVPRYAEILGEAFARIDFDPDEFEVFRVRMRYPPIPASVMVRHSLPSPPIH